MSTTGETGQANVVRTTLGELEGKILLVYILMGPTGSGKSTFIESLSSDGALSISKDSLDSVTQEVVCYSVAKIGDIFLDTDFHFILMDTPGFLDTKLSESRVTKMIVDELDVLHVSARHVTVSIFYFHPITDIRMGGSKRDAIRLLRAFAVSFRAESINIITTMWNMVSTPTQTLLANQRLETLKADIFKQSGNMRIEVLKFEFNYESAASVIRIGIAGWTHTKGKSGDANPQFQSIALKNLLQRIENAHQHLQQLAEDRKYANIPGKENYQLLQVVNRDETVVLAALSSFLDDLYDLDPGRCSSPFPEYQGLPLPSSSGLSSSSLIPPSYRKPLHPPVPVEVSPSPHTRAEPVGPTLAHHISPVPTPSPTPSGSRIKRLLAPVRKLLKRRK